MCHELPKVHPRCAKVATGELILVHLSSRLAPVWLAPDAVWRTFKHFFSIFAHSSQLSRQFAELSCLSHACSAKMHIHSRKVVLKKCRKMRKPWPRAAKSTSKVRSSGHRWTAFATFGLTSDAIWLILPRS